MHEMPDAIAAKAGRLLRLLFVRLGQVPAGSSAAFLLQPAPLINRSSQAVRICSNSAWRLTLDRSSGFTLLFGDMKSLLAMHADKLFI
jgi:hypothetical protein